MGRPNSSALDLRASRMAAAPSLTWLEFPRDKSQGLGDLRAGLNRSGPPMSTLPGGSRRPENAQMDTAPSSRLPQPSLTSRARAVFLEGRLQFGQGLHAGAGADALILGHGNTPLVALVIVDCGGHRHNLSLETAIALGSGSPAST